MSPRYFQALAKRHREIRKHEHDRADFRAGTIAQAVVNANGGIPVEGQKEGRVARVTDFFPWLEDVLGENEEAGNDVGAFIRALKASGAVDRRGR